MTLKKTICTLGEQLRAAREKSNQSLKEVASCIGIDTSLLGKIERNERPATKDQIKQLAIYYQIEEKILLKELLSDHFAYMIINEHADLDTLRVAEEKVEYLKINKNGK
ncbi:MAG: helix-turn-helix transcriptional regulator [Saprospiraceae bacterium]|jgi:transcriptional regulator with XRE-family HTH domain|uniref:helix-turn-helix domain-containing protein n=1 Tax=Candidatus Brachybacter algidus TaxID=2982024 RepID=UPI001DEF117E|nr:helix-turn-helix transcriptional regulator [Candidatus Brachybacter algidus]MBK6447434.1 helix-turn-helix transcriptional regulator [Candidatus Brachybacter algidus]MBK8356674.1 helix-turn-helix transcriptional regulator [Candidatus Brachybacter algidus]MBK8747147.1 helix-turn-helix transcriptional regulator [Candidatus Brachybacter algidus]MBK9023987.1 helix-turn-helix transcriptional regulator [Candidatus Brachybacter algidus]